LARLNGKITLITGAARGIGEAIARAFVGIRELTRMSSRPAVVSLVQYWQNCSGKTPPRFNHLDTTSLLQNGTHIRSRGRDGIPREYENVDGRSSWKRSAS
jgi:hypothetical protein